MTPTLTAVRAHLHALVSTAAFDMTVLDVEPLNETPGPFYATVSLARVTPTDQVWQIRIYVSYRDAGSESARTLDEAIEAVEDALTASSLYTAPEWAIGTDDDLGRWIARTDVERGREDFG